MHIRKRTILIAEDNPGLSRVLSFKFKSCGFDPVSCLDGGAAWKAFQASKIDAVVSDHEMPVLSGVDLIERIRSVDSRIPCFMVTGRQLELHADPRVSDLDILEIFGKPFSPIAIIDAVTTALASHHCTSPVDQADALETTE